MKQTGFLISEVQPTDYIYTGAIGEKIDWSKYLPATEDQYKLYKFDTMSCTTFSALSLLEMQFKYFIETGKLTNEQLSFLRNNNYFLNGEVNFSDRYTAIKSGTTINGNTYQNVGNSIRHDGLIPETMFPFEADSFDEYHKGVTPEMDALGKQFARLFDTQYMLVYYRGRQDNIESIKNVLSIAPVQLAIPVPSHHAVAGYEFGDNVKYLDTYDPYLKEVSKDSINHSAIYQLIQRKEPAMKKGDKGEEVKELQRKLNDKGYTLTVDGDFGPATEQTVKLFQKENGLTPDGIVGQFTLEKLNETKKYKYFTSKEVSGLKDELVSKLDTLREEVGSPFVINSGLRTKEHNAEVGGVANSSHTTGYAVDIACTSDSIRHKMITLAGKHGITRIGVGKNFVHLDVDPSKTQNVIWTY